MAANYKWKKLILGNSVKQDNLTYPPTMSSTPAAFNAPAGMASVATDDAYNPGVSYAAGDLLFYTDGATVYDSTGAIMNGGTLNGLGGTKAGAQPAVILKSTETNYWWILSISAGGRVYSSTVNMAGNSGRGTVDQKAVTVNIGATVTDRFNAYYSTSTSQYGFICHLTGSNRWKSALITGISSHNPTFSAVTTTAIGNIYANNDAANHATVKFNEDNTKMATVYQTAVGTSSSPVTSAIVEVYDFNPATGVPSNFNSFLVNIKDAGAVAPGAGNDGRLKGYDLEWDFDTDTLYIPTYDSTHGLGIEWFTLNASNAVTSQGVVGKSRSSIGNNADKAIFGMYKDPYEDRIYIAKPAVIGTTGGYSSDYNDTYATDRVSVIIDTATPSTSEFVETLTTTVPGDTIGKGMPTRPMAGEEAGASDYYRLTPCDTQKEYVMDTNGSIWVLDGSLDATKIADVSSISDRVNIAVQKETNFIYLLAGTGATPKIYKIDTVTGTVDAGTTVSGTGITGFNSICSKDGDAAKLYAVITIAGPHYNYAEITIATGSTTKTAGNTSHIAVDTAIIGGTLYMASGDDLYKNTGPGTWATVGANTLSKDYEGLSTDDTTLYGYIEGKRYTINTSTGAASAGQSITINSSTSTWNYTVQGAGIVNVGVINTNDTNPGSELGKVITVTNYSGCYTVSTTGSGSDVIGTILSSSADCGSCSSTESDNYCKLLISCCDSGYKGLGFTREIVGVSDDPTCSVGSYYEITANAQSNDQLNRCVEVQDTDDSLYILNNSDGYRIDITTGILSEESTIGGEDIAFNKHGVGFISGGSTLSYTIPTFSTYKDLPKGNSTPISIPQNRAIGFNYSDELITGGVISGVTQISRNSINKKGVLTTINTLTNTNVLLTGDFAVDKITGNYYCVGDSSPSATPETNDLFKLDPSTLAETHIASLTTTLSLSAWQNIKAIEIVKDACYVVVWDTKTYGITLYRINKDTGALISSLVLKSNDGNEKFINPPTGLGYNNPCIYWEAGAFKFVNYSSCSTCLASATSKTCCYELVDCATGVSTITKTDLSSYLDHIIVTDTPGKCYTVYTYDNSITCSGIDVNVTSQYADCVSCTGTQTKCYRLLKCDDPTSDPKYTTEALTPMIRNKKGKSVQLEGESFCRNVDDAGNAVELISATAQTIKSTKASCGKCNFYLKLKQCGAQNIVRYVDYASSTTLHPFIGTGSVKIQDLGKGENGHCWEIDSTIYGPTSTLRPKAQLVLSGPDCTICNAQNNEAVLPATIKIDSCCPDLNPGVDFGNTQWYSNDGSVVSLVTSGDLVYWGSLIDPDGNTVTGCFKIEMSPSPVNPNFLSSVQIVGSSSDASKCESCDPGFTSGCDTLNSNAIMMLSCTGDAPIAVTANTFNNYDNNAHTVFNFEEIEYYGCWKRCVTADYVHGSNWYWGFASGQTWQNSIGYPTVQMAGSSNMGTSDDNLNDNNFFTKFGSTAHSAHETFTAGTKEYTRGALMFYSDGRFVYNSNHQIMAGSVDGNGTPLLSGGVDPNGVFQYASQQCITVPKPDSARFTGSTTYKQYYLIYQRPGTLRALYAVLDMDTADGLGQIISYDQELPYTPGSSNLSTERLSVSSRPAIADSEDDEYWVFDVVPYEPPQGFFPSPPGKIRAWKISSTGIDLPVISAMAGSINNTPWAITEENSNVSEWARIKVAPDNSHIAITGNKDGIGWTQLYSFDETTGVCVGVWQDIHAIGMTNCGLQNAADIYNVPLNFLPFTHGVEFGDNALFIYRSGGSYVNEWQCNEYDNGNGTMTWNYLNGTWETSTYYNPQEGGYPSLHKAILSWVNLSDYSTGQQTQDIDETLPSIGSTSFKVSNPSTRLVFETEQLLLTQPQYCSDGYCEQPSDIRPLLQNSIVTDLHRGPDGALYAGLVLGDGSSGIANTRNWRNTFLGITSALDETPDYDYTFMGAAQTSDWTPDPDGNSSQRIAQAGALRRFQISNVDLGNGDGYVYPSGINVFNRREIAVVNESKIDFGFPQYIKRRCFAADVDAVSPTIQNTFPHCAGAQANGNCFNPPTEPDVFKIINCTQGSEGCQSSNTCQDFTPGTAIQDDGESQRFGMTEWLNPDILDAIQALPLGPQAVYMTYSFPREGSIMSSGSFLPTCSGSDYSPGSGPYANGQWTVPKHESGPGTDNAQGNNSSGNVFDKTYTITEAEFRAEIGKAFDQVSQLFESVFSISNGYPNNLTLRFTDLGKETGTDSNLTNTALDNWSTTAPIGFVTSSGASGVGDFRIWFGRHSQWCLNSNGNPGSYQTSGCTGCIYSGSAGGALAWAWGPSYLNNASGYDGTTGTYNVDPTTSYRTAGSQNIIFDVNENWRKTTDTQVSGTYEILRVGIHEILHSFGFGHAYESMASYPGGQCTGTTSSGTVLNSYFPAMGGFLCPNNGYYNSGCQASPTYGGDPNAIMAPTANSDSFTTIYAFGTDTAYDPNACYMSGGSAAAIQDRTMACQIYGYSYSDQGNFCTPFECPVCVSQFYYTDQESFWQYVGNIGNSSFSWNPGTGLSCWYVEPVDSLPEGDSLTTINPVEDYVDCEACNVQFLAPRWRLVLCDECPENAGNGAPGEIITTTDMSQYCNPGISPLDDPISDVIELVGYIGCYKVDCTYDPYVNYPDSAVAVVVSTVAEDCDSCCNTTVTQCYTVTQCADTNPISFVMIGDQYWGGITDLGDYVFKFEQLPADVLALGLTNDDCFTVAYCGECNETTCSPLIGPGLLTVTESWPGCYSCLYENPNQECFKLVCCDSSGDQLINVLPNADLNNAFATGTVVKISQYPDSQGNPRCWQIETQDVCNPEIAVTVTDTFVGCQFCSATVSTTGCTDPSALNWCPQCVTCLSPLGVLNECCIYEGCPLSCQDPTATNYNPNNTCDCNGVEGGDDISCCEYPAIVLPPEGIEVTFEKDCTNCLDWATVDKVFSNAAELCGTCFPPKGLTLREYNCDLTDVTETIIPPVEVPGGCTNPDALNYDAAAEWDDGSCYYTSACTDPNACNFDPNAVENNPDECIYPGECGCEDFTDSCVGCMDLTACNYNPNATVPDNSLCEYASCYGCTDPEAGNYCADCIMCPDAACCANNVQSCLDNRNIYVFYDMTSILNSGNNEDRLQAVVDLRNLVEASVSQILTDNEITNFSGNIYHLPVGASFGGNTASGSWRIGTNPANWIPYETPGSGTGNINNSSAYYLGGNTTALTEDFPGWPTVLPTDNNVNNEGVGSGERWLQWMMYPLHGNSAALHPNLRIPFSSVTGVYKDTGLPVDNQTNEERLLIRSINSNGLDQNGNYINNLPGTQVNPFNDPPGEEGFSDVYHQFEGGDTNAICIAFIDESNPVYYTLTEPAAPACTTDMLVSDNLCGPGIINNTQTACGNASWYGTAPGVDVFDIYITAPFCFDHTRFTEAWNYGYDTNGAAPMTVKYANGPIGSGYANGNFNGIIIPTKLSGAPGGDANQMFISTLYGSIGQGNPSELGHISCADFIDLPWPNARSMAPYTDTYWPNPFSWTNNSMVTTALHDGSTIPPGRYSSQGFSLANYGMTFKIPAAGEELLQISQDELADAILQGLLCNNGG